MIFVDASALVAILGEEADADAFVQRLEVETPKVTSAVVRWEAVAALCKSYNHAVPDAVTLVDSLLAIYAVELQAIGLTESILAVDAYRVYGKGRHPAALNMGDCFAYACAKAVGAQLLYKGDDFSLTDLA